MSFPYPIPEPTAAFRPRADAGVYSALIEETWREQNDAVAIQLPEIVAAAAAVLSAYAPESDLAVLRRYGFTETRSEITVRIHDGKDYSNTYRLELPGRIEVPSSLCDLVACSPARAWRADPFRGCKPDYWAKLSDAERAEIVESQEAGSRRELPESCDAFFRDVVERRRAYRAEWRRSQGYPAEFKTTHGRWPTWGELAEAFPVFGAYVERQRVVRRAEAA